MRVFDQVRQGLSFGKAAVAFARAVRDPGRLADIFAFIDDGVTRRPELMDPLIAAFQATDTGRRALAQRVRVGRVELDVLARNPPGSLGAAFVSHLRKNGLDPSALPIREARTDAEYVAAHLYETHDLWHVATGFGGDRAGELGLQAFYLAQGPSRVASGILAIGSMNTLLFEFEDHAARMEAMARGWNLGRSCGSLYGFDWAARWAEPLSSVRRALGIDLEGDALRVPSRHVSAA
jgi:ubiquinone biosynthesis protein COQ4